MRVRFLTWFLIVSSAKAISSSGLHRNVSSEHRSLNSSTKSNMQTQQPFENYGSIKEAIRLHKNDEERNKYELSYDSTKKAQKGGKGAIGGKGATGGANVNHHPRQYVNSATSLLSWMSSVFVSLTLILVFSFHVKVL